MAITDIPSGIREVPARRRMRVDGYIIIVGTIAVAALGIARFISEPSYETRQTAAQAALTFEHQKVCEQLGKSNGADRDNCLKALDALYMVHQKTILADSSESRAASSGKLQRQAAAFLFIAAARLTSPPIRRHALLASLARLAADLRDFFVAIAIAIFLPDLILWLPKHVFPAVCWDASRRRMGVAGLVRR